MENKTSGSMGIVSNHKLRHGKAPAFRLKDNRITGMLRNVPGNPRNSEGSFLVMEDGRVAFVWSRYFGGLGEDHDPCNICVIYSHDGGETFDTEHYETLVTAEEHGEPNVMSTTLRYMNNGDIGLFYLLIHPGLTSEYFLRRYRGDFSHPVGEVKCLPNDYKSYFVINNDRVLHCSDGTWMIPAAYHHTSHSAYPGMEPNSLEYIIDEQGHMRFTNFYYNSRAIVHFFISEDDGVTWRQLWANLRCPDHYSESGLQEPGLVELPGGVLYCYSRTDRMYQYESVSLDGGESWFAPQPSRFTSPNSPMLIKRNPHSGLYYAVWNPIPQYLSRLIPQEQWTPSREPLVIAQSEDGIHFSAPVIIEDDPRKESSYPSMDFLDEKTILLSYYSAGVEEEAGSVFRRLIVE